ncbi:coatomer subunit beta [Trichonephila clavipes]|uniref:Coatomer subunit beta n=1 Tax=Trichonephila clavipes TaxID=2585209 RepID=A0A8X6VTV9_TRICX|nr:coatomer subunit beta [Trichonephila clavipes]
MIFLGSASDRSVVVLNDIHIDIMDYIIPATCTDQEFRQMWAEFEWENKVSVNTNLTDLYDYLSHLIGFTNMRCLTPEKALSGECGFMAANLYARSIFGEYALPMMVHYCEEEMNSIVYLALDSHDDLWLICVTYKYVAPNRAWARLDRAMNQ